MRHFHAAKPWAPTQMIMSWLRVRLLQLFPTSIVVPYQWYRSNCIYLILPYSIRVGPRPDPLCGSVPWRVVLHATHERDLFSAHWAPFSPSKISHNLKDRTYTWCYNTKNETPLSRFASLFYNRAIYQKSVWHFFYHLWPLGQKSVKQVFDKRSGCKIIKQNVPGGVWFYWF